MSAGTQRYVVRIFPESGHENAEREQLAMTAAVRHRLPVPSVVLKGMVVSRPALVTEFVVGCTVLEELRKRRGESRAIGKTMGETLGHLHEIPAPAGITRYRHDWVDRGGPALDAIRRMLLELPRQDRLIHLDYHPMNVLVDDGCVTGVIDWENALAGPPHMDVARSRAILHVAKETKRVPAGEKDVLDQFEHGFVEGHESAIGRDPHPELSAAWGAAMTVEDLAGHLGKPGSFVTAELLGALTEERDALIERALRRACGADDS